MTRPGTEDRNQIAGISGSAISQRSIDRVQIEALRIERTSDPSEHAFMFVVLWILDGGQELQVARYATDIIGWRGTFAGNAQGIKPVRVWLGNRLYLDTMAPAVSEVVFVNELANGLAENAPERVFLLVPATFDLRIVARLWRDRADLLWPVDWRLTAAGKVRVRANSRSSSFT